MADIEEVFKTGAEAEIATRWNKRSWAAIRFRPRVLVPVSKIDISTSIFSNGFSAPFFIAPAGGGKFSNRQGEVLWTEAAARHGILQWVCNNAGCSQREMADARGDNQILYWQIYAMKNLETTKREIEQAVALGYKGFALTVDAIHVGKRERDMRTNIAERVRSKIFPRAPRNIAYKARKTISIALTTTTAQQAPSPCRGRGTPSCQDYGGNPTD